MNATQTKRRPWPRVWVVLPDGHVVQHATNRAPAVAVVTPTGRPDRPWAVVSYVKSERTARWVIRTRGLTGDVRTLPVYDNEATRDAALEAHRAQSDRDRAARTAARRASKNATDPNGPGAGRDATDEEWDALAAPAAVRLDRAVMVLTLLKNGRGVIEGPGFTATFHGHRGLFYATQTTAGPKPVVAASRNRDEAVRDLAVALGVVADRYVVQVEMTRDGR